MKSSIIGKFGAGLCSVLTLGTALQASAVSHQVDYIFGDSSGAGSASPLYAQLTVSQDLDGDGTVKFEFSALDLAPTEFISYLKFNVTGSATSPTLGGVLDRNGVFQDPTFRFDAEKPAKTDPDPFFVVQLDFATSNGKGTDKKANGGATPSAGEDKRFTDGDLFAWSLNRDGLSIDDIGLPMEIHLQGMDDGGSLKIAATRVLPFTPQGGSPDPGPLGLPDGGTSLLLLGLGLLLVRSFSRSGADR